MTTSFIILLVFGLGGWFWFETLYVRELATGMARNACRHYDVQFLDETVALNRLGLGRNNIQHLCIRRVYQFEFTASGASRQKGYVILLSRELESLQMETSETAH